MLLSLLPLRLSLMMPLICAHTMAPLPPLSTFLTRLLPQIDAALLRYYALSPPLFADYFFHFRDEIMFDYLLFASSFR